MTKEYIKSFCLAALGLTLSLAVHAQYPKDNPKDDGVASKVYPQLKPLHMTPIAGAPVLSQPVLLRGTKAEIHTGKHGLCYPAILDVNHDGKPDLLLGEFSTGAKENNIKVYLNSGSSRKPKFTGLWTYLRDTKGDTISNSQWCCIGIHPRVVDITGDGIPDILSGQYNPGVVSLWRGTADGGFLSREDVPQEGFVPGEMMKSQDPTDPRCNEYWNYTSASFADYDNDGRLDLFVGGGAGLRVALNVGTKSQPHFGLRQYLRFTDGKPLCIDPDNHPLMEGGHVTFFKTYMTPVDWDGDGVLDLLVTYEYDRKGSHAVLFYKGVKTNLGLRFQHPVPVFTAEDGGKEMPGCQPMIVVGDINGDGINDIVMGLSEPTLFGQVQTDLAWKWIQDLGTEMPGKDAGEYYMYTTRDSLMDRVKREPWAKEYFMGKLEDTKYLDLRHRGYVYVFYGKKNPVTATAFETLHVEAPKPVETQAFDAEEPLSYHVSQQRVSDGIIRVTLTLRFKDGWHGYADIPATQTMGMIPTKVEVTNKPDKNSKWILQGELTPPYVGGNPILRGDVKYTQDVACFTSIDKLEQPVVLHFKISYQACDEHRCLMPQEHELEYTVKK